MSEINSLIDTSVPTHNRDAEQAVIGPMIRFHQIFDEISEFVAEEDFYFDAHRRLFRTVQQMHARGESVDPVLVGYKLKQEGQLEDIGGEVYLIELFEADPTGANAVFFAKAVREIAQRRRVIQCCQQAIRHAYQNRPIDEIIADLEDELNRTQTSNERLKVYHFATTTEPEFQRIMDAQSGKQCENGILTGVEKIDEAMGGIRPGITVVGARTSVGKTAFGLQLLRAAAAAGVPALMVSLEMDPSELLRRQIASMARIDLRTIIISPEVLTGDETNRIHDSLRRIEGMPLYYLDCDHLNPSQFQMAVRRAIHKFGIRVVVLDYVQLMTGEHPKSPRFEQLSDITRTLKTFQRRYKIALIELAQLNRNSLSNEEPRLSDFRECGSIEQDADNAILLWRTSEEDEKTLTIGCHIAKQRNGPLPKFSMTFRKRIATFENYESKPVDVR